MKKYTGAALVQALLLTCLMPAPADAREIHMHVIAGQSNPYGQATPFTSKVGDDEVDLWPEYALDDPADADMTRGEYPIGDDPEKPRWQQIVNRRPFPLGPPPGQVRWSADVYFGRLIHSDIRKTAPGARAAIAKFAMGASSMNVNWTNSGSVDLSDRLIMFLQEVKEKIEANGDTVVWRSFSIWQGESDSQDEVNALAHARGTRGLILKMQRFTGEPNLPILIVQTSIDVSFLKEHTRPRRTELLNIIKNGQYVLAKEDPDNRALVKTFGLPHADALHFRHDQYEIIARRMFLEWRMLRDKAALASTK